MRVFGAGRPATSSPSWWSASSPSTQTARCCSLVPPVVLCVHLWQTGQIRSREERESWQRLAQTTDELNVVDLDAVLHVGRGPRRRAVLRRRGRDRDPPRPRRPRLVRGTPSGVTYDGDAGRARPAGRPRHRAELAGHDGSDPVGELRLRLPRPGHADRAGAVQARRPSPRRCARRSATPPRTPSCSGSPPSTRYAAAHDPLTGLANRRELLEQAAELFAERPDDGMLALLLIDLNHFKEVNDTLGHAAGDQVLREVAQRLRGRVAARRPGRPARRRRVRRPAHRAAHPGDGHAPRRGAAGRAGPQPSRSTACGSPSRPAGGIALAPGSGGVTRAAAPRRRGHVPGQTRRPADRDYVHSRDTADVGRLMLGGDLQPGGRRAASSSSTSSRSSTWAAARSSRPRRWPAGTTRSTATSRPMQFLETVERSGQLPAFADAVLEQSLTAVEQLARGRLRPAGRGQRVAAQPARPGVPGGRAGPARRATASRPTGWCSSWPRR